MGYGEAKWGKLQNKSYRTVTELGTGVYGCPRDPGAAVGEAAEPSLGHSKSLSQISSGFLQPGVNPSAATARRALTELSPAFLHNHTHLSALMEAMERTL